MHEYHIVDALVKQIVAKATEHQAAKVTLVRLVLAHDSGFDPGSIRLYFSQTAFNTVAAEAELSFETVRRSNPDVPSVSIKDIEIEN